jgi:hypothetical protein
MPSDAKRKEREREKENGKIGKEEKRKEKWWDPRLEGDMEGLQEWRLGGGIWRGMQNGDMFRDPSGVGFLHQTSKY